MGPVGASWGLRCSATLRRLDRQLLTDVSAQFIGAFSSPGRRLREDFFLLSMTPEEGSRMVSRNVGKKTNSFRRVTSQKSGWSLRFCFSSLRKNLSREQLLYCSDTFDIMMSFIYYLFYYLLLIYCLFILIFITYFFISLLFILLFLYYLFNIYYLFLYFFIISLLLIYCLFIYLLLFIYCFFIYYLFIICLFIKYLLFIYYFSYYLFIIYLFNLIFIFINLLFILLFIY